MTQSGESESAERLLVELQFFDMSGQILADGRFVLEVKDGIGRATETLRSLTTMHGYRMDLRVSELLLRSERDELERLREIVRALPKEAVQ